MADEVRLIDANSVCGKLQQLIAEYERRIPDYSANDVLGNGKKAARKWGNKADGIEKAISVINAAPTIEAEPDNGWISVDDRLPDDKERYLICTEDGRIDIAYYQPIGDKFSDYEPFWQGSCRFTTSVTYWQHLPEPPKEVENETN